MPISLFGSKGSSEHPQPADKGLLGVKTMSDFVFRTHHLHCTQTILNKCVNKQDGGCGQNVFKGSAEVKETYIMILAPTEISGNSSWHPMGKRLAEWVLIC